MSLFSSIFLSYSYHPHTIAIDLLVTGRGISHYVAGYHWVHGDHIKLSTQIPMQEQESDCGDQDPLICMYSEDVHDAESRKM